MKSPITSMTDAERQLVEAGKLIPIGAIVQVREANLQYLLHNATQYGYVRSFKRLDHHQVRLCTEPRPYKLTHSMARAKVFKDPLQVHDCITRIKQYWHAWGWTDTDCFVRSETVYRLPKWADVMRGQLQCVRTAQ